MANPELQIQAEAAEAAEAGLALLLVAQVAPAS
jgi:hypothetical protein